MPDSIFTLICDIEYKMSMFLEQEMDKTILEGFSHSYGKILIELDKVEFISMKKLAILINKTPQTLTSLMSKLIEKDFVMIKLDTEDNRMKNVYITEKGSQLIPQILEISDCMYERQFQNFTDEEKIHFRNLLKKLQQNFSEEEVREN